MKNFMKKLVALMMLLTITFTQVNTITYAAQVDTEEGYEIDTYGISPGLDELGQ